MPKFIVTETVPCVQVWTYEVEAKNEEKAIELAMDNKANILDSVVEDHDYDEAEYEVEEDEDEE